MTQVTFSNETEEFVNQVMRKFQAYAIVDIENKITRLLLKGTRDEFFDEKVSKLVDERNQYERASKAQLLEVFLTSAKERTFEEELSNAKMVFDLILSKERFSSFH